MERTYLDWNATAPVLPQAVDAAARAMRECWGNASSTHEEGRRAAAEADRARQGLASWTRSSPAEWILTSGGTESIHAAILGCASARSGRRRIVSSQGEHACTAGILAELEAQGWEVVRIPLREDGTWDPREALAACESEPTALASLIWANNETGAISEVEDLAARLRRMRVPLHLDAVQCFGRIPVDLAEVPASLVSLSGHKFGSPKGTGALFVRQGTPWKRWMMGGDQERSRRGGTTNAPGAAGLRAALDAAREADWGPIASARDAFEERLSSEIPAARVLSRTARRLPNTTCATFPGADSGALLDRLDARGFSVSSGSACSSGSPEPSHVLLAMGIPPEDAHCALRISLGSSSSPDDLPRLLPVLAEEVRSLRSLSDFRP